MDGMLLEDLFYELLSFSKHLLRPLGRQALCWAPEIRRGGQTDLVPGAMGLTSSEKNKKEGIKSKITTICVEVYEGNKKGKLRGSFLAGLVRKGPPEVWHLGQDLEGREGAR